MHIRVLIFVETDNKDSGRDNEQEGDGRENAVGQDEGVILRDLSKSIPHA